MYSFTPIFLGVMFKRHNYARCRLEIGHYAASASIDQGPLGVSPSKGNQGTTRGKEKILLTSVGIEPTTSGIDLPLL